MRISTIYVRHNLGKGLICAEIGVKEGEHAIEMLDFLPIKKLYLIDPFLPYERSSDEKVVFTSLFANSKELMEEYYLTTKTRLQKYNGFTELMRMTSEEASQLLKDIQFDFVYIDGNHCNEYVVKDLNNWYSLVKKGGVLAGHDAHFKEVINAVNDFKDLHKDEIEYNVSEYDWIIKKKT